MLKNINKNEKATVCIDKVCVTAQGELARVINVVILITAFISLVSIVSNTLK